MNNLSLYTLRYKLIVENRIEFLNPPPVSKVTSRFSMQLKDGIVCFEILNPHSSENSAMNEVGPFLKSWEISSLFKEGIQIRFDYMGSSAISVVPGKTQLLSGYTEFHIDNRPLWEKERSQYPSLPPQNFKATLDVKTMFDRYRDYLRGREKLTSMAYMCFTVFCCTAVSKDGLKRRGEDKKKEVIAAKIYKVSKNVLDKLRILSSAKGNKSEVRKVPVREEEPLTSNEKEWIKSVIKALIIRLGEYAYDPNTPFEEITMNNFPQI